MHRFYFPACPVDGPIEPPVPFGHMGTSGAIPNKCGSCRHSFEGSCTRFMDEVQRYMHLDFGPCGIPGPTDPVAYEDEFITSKVEIPRKCAKCPFLFTDRIYGFNCRKDTEKWGDCYRGLDWGSWSPDTIYLQLPVPKVTTKELARFARENDLVSFVREHRRVNPALSLEEARADFARFRELLAR